MKLMISQKELAFRCKCSQTSLSQIENGKKKPTRKTIAKICIAMDIPESIIYIIGMEEIDFKEEKKEAFQLFFPSIKNLALQIVN